MTKRKHSPMHDYWHPRIEGAINSVILAHPNWFRFRNAEEQRTCVNSLAKRLVGTIVGSGEPPPPGQALHHGRLPDR